MSYQIRPGEQGQSLPTYIWIKKVYVQSAVLTPSTVILAYKSAINSVLAVSYPLSSSFIKLLHLQRLADIVLLSMLTCQIPGY